jgi:type IV secretion system protein VirB5
MVMAIARWASMSLVLFAAAVPAARAQWAVIDVGAIAQLIQEVQTLRQQLLTAEAQLNQAEAALATTTGNRAMQLLLSGIVRNYLPTSAAQLTAASQGTGSYPSLASGVQASMTSNAVISPSQLAALPPPASQQVIADRQTVALRQAVAAQALSNSSGRFASIQSLIAAIPSTQDQKGILELQARINAELGMLQNEQTKLQVLAQATEAMSAVNAQREREQIIVGQGQFATRFQPSP